VSLWVSHDYDTGEVSRDVERTFMSFRTALVVALSLALGSMGLLLARPVGGGERHHADPIYGYICVLAGVADAHGLPRVCVANHIE
jgi:hypothetical protein